MSATPAQHSAESCEPCRQLYGGDYRTITLSAKAWTEHSNGGCPTISLYERARTAHGNRGRAEYRISAGGRRPIRCDGLEIYAIVPHSEIGRLNDISPDSASSDCIEKVRSWVKDCDVMHGKNCKDTGNHDLPGRLIDLGESQTSKTRLIQTSGIKHKYIALSHCWGPATTIRAWNTTTQNIASRLQELDPDILPRTFQDAITVARAVDVRYLWIDSLCIVQDDHNDWLVESSKMTDVYGNSYLTIAASLGKSDEAGFLRDRKAAVLAKPLDQGLHCRQEVDHECDRGAELLTTRAWCFQERLLPRRVVTWHANELTWECREFHACECGRNESYARCADRIRYERKVLDATSKHDELYDYWYINLVKEYTSLFLTHETDRLFALKALAQRHQILLQDKYVKGLWRGSFLAGLTWRSLGAWAYNTASRYIPFISLARLKDNDIAPSWSWASVECVGPINYDVLLEGRKITYLDERVEFQCHCNDTITTATGHFDCAVELGGLLIPAKVGISSTIELREQVHAVTGTQTLLLGFSRPHNLQSHAIPHYPLYIEGHGPRHTDELGCDCGVGCAETAILWPDAQLDTDTWISPSQTGSEPLGTAKRCREVQEQPSAATIQAFCLFFYRTPGTLGGMLIRPREGSDTEYVRLGLVEMYERHPAFEQIGDMEISRIILR